MVFFFLSILLFAALLTLGGLIVLGIGLARGRQPLGLAGLFTLCAGTVFGATATDLYGDPALFTHEMEPTTALTVSHLTYLNGLLGATYRIRVDTDDGIYVVTSDALLPEAGLVYRTARTRPWGGGARVFLCLDREASRCWPTLALDP